MRAKERPQYSAHFSKESGGARLYLGLIHVIGALYFVARRGNSNTQRERERSTEQ